MDLRPSKKKNGRQPGRLTGKGGAEQYIQATITVDWSLWSFMRPTAFLCGATGAEFSIIRRALLQKDLKICVTLVLWSEYRHGNEVILRRSDD